jgi:type VI secretion system protein ImpK
VKPNPRGDGDDLPPMAERPAMVRFSDLAASAQGLNRLVALANPLLVASTELRVTPQVDDPSALRNALAQSVREFVACGAAAGIASDRLIAARYVVCTMIDECAADSPWGGSGLWARHSLLALFHGETWGGEKVFQLMARLAEKPRENLDLLELIYSAIVLGFEGRYRVIDNGEAQLEAVRDRLAQIIKRERGDYARSLSQHWRAAKVERPRILTWLPLVATVALVVLGLVLLHLGLLLALDRRSDPVFAQIAKLRLPPPTLLAAAPAFAAPRLAQFLQSDIKNGQVGVRDEVDRSVVTIRGDGLFAAGSTELLPDRQALMGRIADALAQVRGPILVTGHTDDQPIRSARFPSNWHLSEERAKVVQAMLVDHKVPVERVRSEGRADTEPVVVNDSLSNRAMNRRVEITLLARPDASPAASAPK